MAPHLRLRLQRCARLLLHAPLLARRSLLRNRTCCSRHASPACRWGYGSGCWLPHPPPPPCGMMRHAAVRELGDDPRRSGWLRDCAAAYDAMMLKTSRTPLAGCPRASQSVRCRSMILAKSCQSSRHAAGYDVSERVRETFKCSDCLSDTLLCGRSPPRIPVEQDALAMHNNVHSRRQTNCDVFNW